MTDDGGMRRLIPPPRRRPGPFAVMVRWRVELLLAAGVAATWHYVGTLAISGVAVALVLAVMFVPTFGKAAVGVVQSIVVPHRVRSGLLQAGVVDRSGRLPWIVMARPRGDAVLVDLWLRAGTTADDLLNAAPIIAAAAGAAGVEIGQRSPRHDRAVVIVHQPRWGWLGK